MSFDNVPRFQGSAHFQSVRESGSSLFNMAESYMLLDLLMCGKSLGACASELSSVFKKYFTPIACEEQIEFLKINKDYLGDSILQQKLLDFSIYMKQQEWTLGKRKREPEQKAPLKKKRLVKEASVIADESPVEMAKYLSELQDLFGQIYNKRESRKPLQALLPKKELEDDVPVKENRSSESSAHQIEKQHLEFQALFGKEYSKGKSCNKPLLTSVPEGNAPGKKIVLAQNASEVVTILAGQKKKQPPLQKKERFVWTEKLDIDLLDFLLKEKNYSKCARALTQSHKLLVKREQCSRRIKHLMTNIDTFDEPIQSKIKAYSDQLEKLNRDYVNSTD